MDKIVSLISKNKTTLILTAIVLVGFLIRLITINSQDGLWYDELYSWWISNHSFPSGILEKLRTEDYHPPLYHFILHFWMKLFGDSDVALKFLSVIFSTVNIPIVYLIGKKLKNENCGLVCAILSTFLLYNLIYATEVRFYPLSVTFAALSLLFLVKIFDEEKITKPLIGLLVSNVLLIYTLSTGAFFVTIANLVLFGFLIAYKKEAIKKFIFSQLATFVLCIPQMIFMLDQYLRGKKALLGAWEIMSFGSFAIFDHILKSFIPRDFIIFYEHGIVSINYACAMIEFLLVIAIIIILYKIFFNENKKFSIIYSIFGLYFLFLFITRYFKIMPLNYNYMGIFIMIFIIMISYLITEYKRTFALILFFTVLSIEIFFSWLSWTKFNDLTFHYKYGFKLPVTFLKEEGYDKNVVIYMPYGAKLINKYMPDVKTSDISHDEILLYYLPENQSKIFDDDAYALEGKERLDYLRNYILAETPSRALKVRYEKLILEVPKGGYFVMILRSGLKRAEVILKNAQDSEKFSSGRKFDMISSKVTLDFYNLAKKDKRLKQVYISENLSQKGSCSGNEIDEEVYKRLGLWNIIVFQRTK